MNDKITPLQKEIGQRIMMCRGENESQEDLAKAIGVSREVIQHWERGSRQIKAGHIALLAKHFGTSPDYLLGFTPAISADGKARATEEYTGLSLDAVKHLREALFTLIALGGDTEIPNWFFSSEYFFELMAATEKYKINTQKSGNTNRYITLDSSQQNIEYKMRQAAKVEMIDVVSGMTKDIDIALNANEEETENNGKH